MIWLSIVETRLDFDCYCDRAVGARIKQDNYFLNGDGVNMSSGQAITNLIIILIVFYFAAFFVAAEFAIVSVRKSAIESALENGEGNQRKLKLALKMVTNMN